MALCSLIRKASPAVVPFAFRAISSPIIPTKSLSMILSSEEFVYACKNKTLSNSHQFSTALLSKKQFDQTFVEVLESEIQSAKQSLPAEPTNFPFEIEDDKYYEDKYDEDFIILKGEILGEKIRVEVSMREIVRAKNAQKDEENEEKPSHSCAIEMYISKKDGDDSYLLYIRLRDSTDNIEFIQINGRNYCGEVCGHHLKKLSIDGHHELKKFLEARGINRINSELLYKYVVRRHKNRNIKFLSKLEEFVKK